MNYLHDIQSQGRGGGRPVNYEDLLFHPIADDPTVAGATCYKNWEFDHGTQRRFYVGGFLWFLGITGLNPNRLADGFKQDAVTVVGKQATWSTMPNSNNHWQEPLARQQFNLARNQSAIFFQKAALIIMACELAAEKILNSGRTLSGVNVPGDIYKYMSIVPATWNINDFNDAFYKDYISRQPAAIDALQNATAQPQPAVFGDLANGRTVSFEVALGVYNTIGTPALPASGFKGNVRARPGKKTLGRLRTSEFESIDCG